MNNLLHEVYFVKVRNSVVYVGMGKRGRHKHTESGISHVYALNKLHFENPLEVSTHVLENNLTKERALELELELIQHYRPVYNKRDNEAFNSKYVPIKYIYEVSKKNRGIE